MTPTHALSAPAPRSAPLPVLVARGARRPGPLPSLTRRAAPSASSGLILALIVLALLLQASFLVGLASGRVAGPAPGAAHPVASAR
ncbi:MAG TPA: hypothetical protein VF841_12250 [Anaeromyxobacter sp.]